jgi:hypothetical protein
MVKVNSKRGGVGGSSFVQAQKLPQHTGLPQPMIHRITLKNSDKTVLISDDALALLESNPYLQSINFIKNLRMHSNGYAFYQKNHPDKVGGYRNETIYLHKYLAEQLLERPKVEGTLYVMFKNSDRLDCRSENLEWASRSFITRNTKKNTSKSGYRGVYQDGNSYRATLYHGKDRYELGFFKNAEDAARAYNTKSEALFGQTRSLNDLQNGTPYNPFKAFTGDE